MGKFVPIRWGYDALFATCVTKFEDVPASQRVKQGTLPLRNDPEKRNLFFNTMVCSSKELGTRISENVGPFP